MICWMRRVIPQPCMGSSANVFRISRSSVPCSNSVGLPIRWPKETVLYAEVRLTAVLSTIESVACFTLNCQEEREPTRVFGLIVRGRQAPRQ